MYDATKFAPTFPSDPIYNFAPALAANTGGAFYTRGDSTGTETPAHGATGVIGGTPDILSGVTPLTGTWAAALAGSPAKKALIYGYQVTPIPSSTNGPRSHRLAMVIESCLVVGIQVAGMVAHS